MTLPKSPEEELAAAEEGRAVVAGDCSDACGSISDACGSITEALPVAAVIGAGFLGVRIAAELLLLGSPVSVYDRGLAERGPRAGQAAVDLAVGQVLRDCDKQGLLGSAGMAAPPLKGPWVPFEGEGPRLARWCSTIGEAVRGADIVIEAVPDNLDVKTSVFVEALAGAPQGVLLATSTLSLPLAHLQRSVASAAWGSEPSPTKERKAPRVVGLRFLAPVVFVPFVEVTLTAAQKNEQEEALLSMLGRWGKNAFGCDVQGAVEGRGTSDAFEGIQRSARRLRLDSVVAMRRQAAEARLRRAHRQGPAALAKLGAADLFDFETQTCCVCLEAKPTAKSLLCGHSVLCDPCARLIESGTRRCPICRTRFMQALNGKRIVRSI